MENLPNDIEARKEINRQLIERIRHLEAENAELRRRLGMDRTNSHCPPSSDGYRKKTTQPGLPKAKGKKRGGQKGHKGKTLERVAKPDHVEVQLPKQCECCGRQFGEEEEYEIIQRRQVFELPEPKLEVTEHRLGQITGCGKEQQGEYPAEVNTPVQYGAGVRALILMLSVDCKMPLEQISQLFADILGYNLNSETILEVLERGYELSAPLEEPIKAALSESEVVHFDETGIRVEGKLYGLHTATNEENTHWYLHEKRGTEALNSKGAILPEYRGIAVHDGGSPYFTFNPVKHALCGAHRLRELKSLIEEGSLWAQEMHEFLLDVYNLPNPVVAEEELRKHYQIILEHAEQEEPPPQQGKRGRPKQSRGRNLLDRLRTYQDSVLAFALEVGVPFTNNQAERDLRPAKVKLKICGGCRTLEGGVVYARIPALISTLRKRGMNVFAQLRDLFSLHLAQLAYPG